MTRIVQNHRTENKERHRQDRAEVGIGTMIVFIAIILTASIAAGTIVSSAELLQEQAESTTEESTLQISTSLEIVSEYGVVGEDNTIDEIRIGIQPTPGSADIDISELNVLLASDTEYEYLSPSLDESEFISDETVDENLLFEENIAEDDTPYTISETVRPDSETNPSQLSSLAFNSQNTNEDNLFDVEAISAQDETNLIMSDISDRYDIIINTSGKEFNFEDLDGVENTELDNEEITGAFLGEISEGESIEITITTEFGSQTQTQLQVPSNLNDNEDGTNVNL